MAFFRALIVLSLVSTAALADVTPVTVLPTKAGLLKGFSSKNITSLVRDSIDLSGFRAARVQMIPGADRHIDHLLVYLHSKISHKFEFASVYLDDQLQVLEVERNYKPTALDRAQQRITAAKCPDTTVQFIAFAPNSLDLEQQVTKDVAAAAVAKGLKTVSLLEDKATSQAYLNYMSCPNLIGNFYDGDANTTEFVTVDGMITSDDMKTLNFNFHVTNIWLACEAYNDPMLSSVTVNAKAQKYAAGVNDLMIGPSDNTGKCAMIAAINGQPMTSAFNACYTQYDNTADIWGFGGQGSDQFGH